MAAAAQHRRQAPDRDMTAFFENTDSNQPAVTFKPVLPVNQIAGILAAIEHRFSAGRQNGIVYFTSAYDRDGADTIALETAYAAACSGHRRVLFLDCSTRPRGLQLRQFRSKVEVTMEQFLKHGARAKGTPFVTAEDGSFFYALLSAGKERHRVPFDASFSKALFERLKSIYDLVVIYSDGGLTSGQAAAFSALSDETVLVVEAEKTRLPVVKELKTIIESSGGHVLGTVLNRRRYYIPRWLYALLF